MFPNNWISCIKKPRGTFKCWKEGPKSVTCVIHSFIKTSRNLSRLGVTSTTLLQRLLTCLNLLALRSHLRGRQRRLCLQWAGVRVAPRAGIRRKQEIMVEVWGRMSSGCVHRRGNSLKMGARHLKLSERFPNIIKSPGKSYCFIFPNIHLNWCVFCFHSDGFSKDLFIWVSSLLWVSSLFTPRPPSGYLRG